MKCIKCGGSRFSTGSRKRCLDCQKNRANERRKKILTGEIAVQESCYTCGINRRAYGSSYCKSCHQKPKKKIPISCKPCRKCGKIDRDIRGRCKPCAKASNDRYHLKAVMSGDIRSCSSCKSRPREIGYFYCRECRLSKARAYQHNNAEKPCAKCKTGARYKSGNSVESYCYECLLAKPNRRNEVLKRTYGISIGDYDRQMEAQKLRCAICNEEVFYDGTVSALFVDHCHDSGKLRGLLCNSCNSGLGHFKDNVNSLRAAISYLESGGVWCNPVS